MYRAIHLPIVLVLFLSINLSCASKNEIGAAPNSNQEQSTSTPTGTNEVNEKESFVSLHGQLRVEGNKIVDEYGNAVQLRGMSFFWSQWMGKYYTPETVSWLKEDWQCTVVRAAMGIEDSEGYITNPQAEKDKIFTIIDAAIANGIYVIVDWHSHHAEDYEDEAKLFFTEIAQKYGARPNIIYELYNEPLDVSWINVLKPYHEAVITEIRKYDPDNIVICGTRNWSQQVNEVIGNEIEDDNVAYTLHYYASSHKQDLRDIAQSALDNDIALFVTEFGTTDYSGDGFIDVQETNTWWKFLDDNAISWCNWSIADKNENSAALQPNASTSGQWPDSAITQSGRLVREELRNKNPKFQ
ncbi:glycoside hydrolase family 5 protein [Maribacter confluentis]|uniref:Glycoside hydrolase family 5 protein n=1 Tax=Maribacter confluentis TaxID=1656093 RepID=A0ABT8RUD4_9FLAO|nr:glycoside hydrolase family 5 protein [Maribacter confluentis]MDO1514228.1 glycoside hydrolase family 5 protein [Maribacter confluentis]